MHTTPCYAHSHIYHRGAPGRSQRDLPIHCPAAHRPEIGHPTRLCSLPRDGSPDSPQLLHPELLPRDGPPTRLCSIPRDGPDSPLLSPPRKQPRDGPPDSPLLSPPRWTTRLASALSPEKAAPRWVTRLASALSPEKAAPRQTTRLASSISTIHTLYYHNCTMPDRGPSTSLLYRSRRGRWTIHLHPDLTSYVHPHQPRQQLTIPPTSP